MWQFFRHFLSTHKTFSKIVTRTSNYLRQHRSTLYTVFITLIAHCIVVNRRFSFSVIDSSRIFAEFRSDDGYSSSRILPRYYSTLIRDHGRDNFTLQERDGFACDQARENFSCHQARQTSRAIKNVIVSRAISTWTLRDRFNRNTLLLIFTDSFALPTKRR